MLFRGIVPTKCGKCGKDLVFMAVRCPKCGTVPVATNVVVCLKRFIYAVVLLACCAFDHNAMRRNLEFAFGIGLFTSLLARLAFIFLGAKTNDRGTVSIKKNLPFNCGLALVLIVLVFPAVATALYVIATSGN